MKPILTLLFTLFFISASVTAQIVITEINYNNPSWDDDDFVELYNNSGADIQMEGYHFVEGFSFVFPNFVLPAGGYTIVANDAPSFMAAYGIEAFEMSSGNLSGSGEDISFFSADSTLVDFVDYEDDSDGWSLFADGRGHSISLCDVDADNEDPANWQATVVDTPIRAGRRALHASPMTGPNCLAGPIVTCAIENNIVEGISDTAFFTIFLTNGNGMPTTIDLAVDPSSTVGASEYILSASSFTFEGNADTSISFTVAMNDDSEAESKEALVVNLSGTNVDKIANESFTLLIYDDDNTPADSALIIAGVFEASIVDDMGENIGSGDEFGVELYAREDIADLSVYSLGTANNGGGTDGVEIPFPAISLSQGDRYFISDSEVRFTSFFGFAPNLTHPSIWVTGNDAIELFHHGNVIDTYAPIDIDGEGTAWDYDEAWAVRIPETTNDGSVPNIENWLVIGIEQLIGTTNDAATAPYPFGFYSITPSSVNQLALDLNLQIAPNPAQDLIQISTDANAGIELLDVTIYNALGTMYQILDYPKGQSKMEINVADLPQGIYYLTINTPQGIVTEKLLKK